jgi:hypothetical protein
LATKARASEMEELRFPKFGYHLDESDPDVVILRRQDGSFVAPFSARVPPRRASSQPLMRIMVGSWRLIQSCNRAKAPRGSGAPIRARNPETFPIYRSASKGRSRNFLCIGFSEVCNIRQCPIIRLRASGGTMGLR